MFNHWTARRGQISSHSSAIGIESNPNPSTCTAADASPLHCWYTGHKKQKHVPTQLSVHHSEAHYSW